MHICFVSPTSIADKSNWGGIHTHTKMIADILSGAGIDVTLITAESESSPSCTKAGEVDIIAVPGSRTRSFDDNWIKGVQDIAVRVHKEKPFDLIFSQSYWAYGLHRCAPLRDVPIFTFVHNYHLIHFQKNFVEIKGLRSLASYLVKTVPKLIYRMFTYEIPFSHSCRYVITGSDINAKYLRRIYRIPERKLKVIYNSVDTDEFKPDESMRAEARLELNVADNVLVFLFAGAIWKPKGCHIAVKAFGSFSRKFPNALLILAGEGPDKSDMQRLLATQEHIRDKVRFYGSSPHQDLPRLFNAADVFLTPTLFYEVLSYSLVEAMSCGLPCITTSVWGNIEAIGDAGILVRPNDADALSDAMLLIAQNQGKRREFSNAARRRVLDNYSTRTAGRDLLALIE